MHNKKLLEYNTLIHNLHLYLAKKLMQLIKGSVYLASVSRKEEIKSQLPQC